MDLFKLPGLGEVQAAKLLLELVGASSRIEELSFRNYGGSTRTGISPVFKKEEEEEKSDFWENIERPTFLQFTPKNKF